ncbi:MAG: PDR/VanB family oxidoreductase [Solirubrobacterales bacterium]
MGSIEEEIDLDLVVSARRQPAAGVVELELRDPRGGRLPAWAPGAHVDVILPNGSARQYSLCGDPGDRSTWRLGVLLEREGRGGSRHIHEQLHEGAAVATRGPRNNFELLPAARYVFIAGGIGVTPIVPMAAAAAAAGADWTLLYGGRSLGTMAFREELAAHGERVAIRPEDEHGLLDLAGALGEPRDDTLIYCCGPAPLLEAVERAAAHWPAGALHLERFAAKEMGAPENEDSFEVELLASGMTITVPPDKSILECVDEAGIYTVSSCQEGTCGSCETVVLEGTPEHRDSLMTPAEQQASETMMICVSRSRCPRLVLDL